MENLALDHASEIWRSGKDQQSCEHQAGEIRMFPQVSGSTLATEGYFQYYIKIPTIAQCTCPPGRVWIETQNALASHNPRPFWLHKGLEYNLARKCLAEMPWFYIQQTSFSDLQCNWSGTTPFLCSTVYSLPGVGRTWTLVDWHGILSLINNDGGTPTPNTLSGKVIPRAARRFWCPDYALAQWYQI